MQSKKKRDKSSKISKPTVKACMLEANNTRLCQSGRRTVVSDASHVAVSGDVTG